MSEIALSRAQMEDVMAAMHRVSPDQRAALKARLRHLQRLKFPPGVNTGSGRAAKWGSRELALLAVAFELAQLGLAPERIVKLIEMTAERLAESFSKVTDTGSFSSAYTGGQILLLVDPAALSYLEGGKEREVTWVLPANYLSDFLANQDNELGPRVAIVDLQAALNNLVTAVSNVTNARRFECFNQFHGEWFDAIHS